MKSDSAGFSPSTRNHPLQKRVAPCYCYCFCYTTILPYYYAGVALGMGPFKEAEGNAPSLGARGQACGVWVRIIIQTNAEYKSYIKDSPIHLYPRFEKLSRPRHNSVCAHLGGTHPERQTARGLFQSGLSPGFHSFQPLIKRWRYTDSDPYYFLAVFMVLPVPSISKLSLRIPSSFLTPQSLKNKSEL